MKLPRPGRVGYNTSVKTLLVLLVVLGQSLLAVCPSGACGVVLADGDAPVPRQEAACCRTASHPGPHGPAVPECPPQPSARCCCQHEATVPEDRPKLAEAAVLPGVQITGDPAAPTRQVVAPVASLLTDPGPPLHVLQCVWLC